MVAKQHIGSTHYSKVLNRNVEVKDGPSDDYYKLIGLECVLEKEEPKVFVSKKKNDTDNQGGDK